MNLEQFTNHVEAPTTSSRPQVPASALPRNPETGQPMPPGPARTGTDAIESTIQRHGEALSLLSK